MTSVHLIEMIESARVFALQVHGGQMRSGARRSQYSDHPVEVASLVAQSGGSAEEVAAAFLHDTIEDTETTTETIRQFFGPVVADIVDDLTDKPDLEGLPTIARKMLQAARVRSKSESVKRVKLADQTSNIRAIIVDPPVDWNKKKCAEYLEGAWHIAQECWGISSFLDLEFQEAHRKASAIYPWV